MAADGSPIIAETASNATRQLSLFPAGNATLHYTIPTSASPSLPDEIIAEILSPALKISDEDFSDNSPIFATYSESSSAFLVV
ncbi:hypothetical protein B0H17DRAFT_1214284 [Mycena rosella]|uniref:Uncharacterized protein n=1 Tax=Mycena rosella TaxID=1033263 RepID=A0AAD7G3B0_MYCRO|nr:hypothetical protein B0H17DRAFT_1214284 [Mycena rosella]